MLLVALLRAHLLGDLKNDLTSQAFLYQPDVWWFVLTEYLPLSLELPLDRLAPQLQHPVLPQLDLLLILLTLLLILLSEPLELDEGEDRLSLSLVELELWLK